MNNMAPMDWVNTAGIWVGFVFTLLIFSALLGDHLLARFAQYVLVGAALGYAVVVTWQSIAESALTAELRADPWSAPWRWIPIALAIVLAVAGLDRIFFQGRPEGSGRPLRHVLRAVGAIPAFALVAVGVAVAISGAVQGTLVPLFLHTARTGLQWGDPPAIFAAGVLTLLLTATTLVFFVVDTERHLANQPGWVQRLVRGSVWVGQRAVWLAAGAIFARLFASRLSLFIAELARWSAAIQSTDFGTALAAWWRLLTGM